MNDLQRLKEHFDAGRLLRPADGNPTLVGLARAMALLSGGRPPARQGSLKLAAVIGDAEHYVFVLADGLGLSLVEGLPDSSFLRRHLTLGLRTVFPSSTAPALTSLATGLWPAQHGLPGWNVYLPEAGVTATALPFVERYSRKPLADFGLKGENLFSHRGLLASYRRDTAACMPRAIVDSAYTRFFAGNQPVHAYDSLAEALETVVSRISGAKAETFSYVYYSAIDALEHAHGPGSSEVRGAVAAFDTDLARLFEALGGKARVVVTADHGHLDIPAAAKLFIEERDELLEMLLCPPVGETRVPMFHTRDGRSADFAALFRRRFGERFALLTRQEVNDIRLLGPDTLTRETRSRLGDFIAVPLGEDVLIYRPETNVSAMKGQHGSLTREEMTTPLVLA